MSEALVLLPGLLSDARLYSPQFNALSRDRAVMVAPITTGERIEEIASAILMSAPQKFALAGLSMGGIVAMEVLRRAPERVTRIALMDCTPLPATPQEATAREDWIVAARAGRFEDAVRAELRAEYLAPGPARADVMAKVMAMAKGMGPEIYVRQARALTRRKDQQATLRKIRQPTLILCGDSDGLTPVKRHEFMAELIPFARLEIIAGAGHLPTLEQPAAVTEALRAWMKQPLVLR